MSNKKYKCSSIRCKKSFYTPNKVTFLVCPFCSTILKQEPDEFECLHYFGYLAKRKKGTDIPQNCIECIKSIECMLTNLSSKDAAEEIQKWYT